MEERQGHRLHNCNMAADRSSCAVKTLGSAGGLAVHFFLLFPTRQHLIQGQL